jgi:hypothetical protein
MDAKNANARERALARERISDAGDDEDGENRHIVGPARLISPQCRPKRHQIWRRGATDTRSSRSLLLTLGGYRFESVGALVSE